MWQLVPKLHYTWIIFHSSITSLSRQCHFCHTYGLVRNCFLNLWHFVTGRCPAWVYPLLFRLQSIFGSSAPNLLPMCCALPYPNLVTISTLFNCSRIVSLSLIDITCMWDHWFVPFESKKYLLQKNTKSSARTAVFWLLPAFAFTQSINRKTLPNSAKRSNNVPPHHVLVSHSELRQPPEESRFQFFPTRTQQDRKKTHTR